jgi:hypothetical protein
VLAGEWNIDLAKPLNFIPLGRSRQEIIVLVITYQLAKTRGLPKSESMIVMNVGHNSVAPCVIVKPLIHTIHVVHRRRGGSTSKGQLKKNIAIE